MPLSPELRDRYEAAELVCLACEPPTSYQKSPYAWYYEWPPGKPTLSRVG